MTHNRPTHYILRNGQAVPEPDLIAWAEWYKAHPEERRVARDGIGPDAVVSTVFLSLDHGWGDGPPLLWETMIFWLDHPLDNDCERYTSRADAEAGHEAAVIKVRQAIQEADGAC